ncbi:VirD4-like conjugal transfer protein, CD1115 family [Lacrimispora indolis]|uniref:VirD4-like conjugal transfer protein, CD1115 family n=1 Tax=Lacrimispora indolis TaxID=69825 RepID=UPI00042190C4|nr:type IV secretory system conjugative DNA transfer family protein [[Clostridium] methoxybenzovorans]
MKWLREFLSGNEERKKLLWGLALLFVLALYVSGLLCQAAVDTAHVSFNPFRCCFTAIFSFRGWRTTFCTIGLFLIFAGFIAYQGRAGGSDMDEERNFKYSSLGTYGTSGYMTEVEKKQVLKEDRDVKDTKGIILGTDLISGNILSLPPESRLNRNIAVCGSQGSMKSRAFARNMILQCIRRGESMFITDPKSELYEDTAAYLKAEGYTVRLWNLIDLDHSDAWDCLAEIDGGGLIDTFVDVVIRNTTDKFDHFYDNTEMDLLKALCLYVYHEYEEKDRTFAEAYKLLINQSLEAIDGIFDNLPTTHPAKGPYRLFSKAEKVKGNAVLGLGTRLQIMQNEKVQKITSYREIDLTLPGREKCAYFCITSDQDSTYDVLATLFVSFLCIKLIRFADRQESRQLPVTVYFILDEFPNIGIVPDFKKKLATARSRNLGMSILYQNIPQLQNRYPDGQWEEILGGCDTSLFLGCNDMTTATYFSGRSGEVTVGVSSVRKNLNTIRMSNYVPDYSETSSVGKRMLLLPDEILRFPLEQALVIIRGQKVLKVKKYDYSRHSDAKKLSLEKTEGYVPEWRKREMDTDNRSVADSKWGSQGERGCSREESFGTEQAGTLEETVESYEEERHMAESAEYSETIEKVEDLFTDEW